MRDPNPPVMIVMIEDDDGHARLIEKNIRRAGGRHEILRFATGAAALDFLLGGGATRPRSPRARLILLDLNLPDMTGLDILARLKADERARRLPVIVLTTSNDKRDIEKCYDLGASVYMIKPPNYDSFANAIQQLGLYPAAIQAPETI
ncbi:hypothetical protein CCR94_15770 [Rhodoblastus sphagnicola]|uniref:Uncharacterized protein n=1 Tax=Rhodoblastus sphagnicola TaxID=333368 RepID=A0A2S6N3T8_9HYPH|nr:response regulator [Rhodoblastus sphagnicola]MBB4198929.1 CheY-like chemotaxis protein [Rhodoblastus sphagnicola]PPQ29266.1 hypothetical protein CCR94_15770 [Rhodoblastus sphagnicola]